MQPPHRRLLAARVLSEANDLKRTPEMLADELGLPVAELRRVLGGEAEVAELHALIDRIAAAYPVDGAELRIPEDDCDRGIKIVRAAASEASRRVAHRADPGGGTSPYYEYRDTAFSRLSPFRPEWIRPLRRVDGGDPPDPADAAVVYNRGHLLHQYTLYVGAVGFYWRTAAGAGGAALDTGDSTYGTPWWPHTFTALDPDRRGYILAVTFGSLARRAQRELYALGRRTHGYVLDYRRGRRAAIQLLDQHLADELTSRDELAARCAAAGVDPAALFDPDREPTPTLIAAAARALSIEPADLQLPPYAPSDEVVIVRRADSTPTAHDRYRVWRLARLSRMPQVKGFCLDVLGGAARADLLTGLHSWVYNHGAVAVAVAWHDGTGEHRAELAPHDSMYLQPFVAHGFGGAAGAGTAAGALCVVRVPGAVDLQTQRELSYLSEVERVYFEDRAWF